MEARFAAALASRRSRGLLRTIDDGISAAAGDCDGGSGAAAAGGGGTGRGRRRGTPLPLVDFASNDYLGLATSAELAAATAAVLVEASAPGDGSASDGGDAGSGGSSGGCGGGSSGGCGGGGDGGAVPDRDRRVYGSGGSRLLTGGSPLHRRVETTAAAAHGWHDALYVGSGYAANLALFSCILGDGDAVVYDEAVHASVHDGLRLSRVARPGGGAGGGGGGNGGGGVRSGVRRLWPFPHNSVPGLVRVATAALAAGAVAPGGTLLVAVESIYSMDGDAAPLGDLLDALAALAAAHPATPPRLVVDEAHGVGVVHPRGALAAAGLSRHPALLAAVVPYGKAHGAAGAVILVASSLMRAYLVNYARPLIYSTAPPPAAAAAILASYPLVCDRRVDALRAVATALRAAATDAGHAFFLAGAAAAAAVSAARARDGSNAASGEAVGRAPEVEGAAELPPPPPPGNVAAASAAVEDADTSGRGRDSPMTDMAEGEADNREDTRPGNVPPWLVEGRNTSEAVMTNGEEKVGKEGRPS
ncbi:hypothetical protein I4F81_007802 [Pyropia yezoensis]|uniref:Uncharacterized protein n=1 Tax=Pyropia yezoensis TaxID=2788 RepID=A0ACC3C5B2_PYRYE|nr:hypothetical protein I4F81_007802 [Neopyropia yezoensis]